MRPQRRRLLFIRTDRLGETLLNLPAAAAFKATYPASHLTFLAHPDLAPLLTALPWIDEVIPDSHAADQLWWRDAWRLSRALKARRFDTAVVSNPQKRLHLAVWLAGVPQRVGYHRKWGRLLTHRVPDCKALGECHEVEYNLALVWTLTGPIAEAAWQFPSDENVRAAPLLRARGLEASQPFIAVHPWSSNPLKVWPLDRYRQLVRRLTGDLAVPVVLIGGAESRGAFAAGPSAGAAVVDLIGRLSLRELAGVLQRARLLVSNDSGPVHLAAAVGTKTVVLFGTSEPAAGPGRWGPWGPGHTVISKPSMDAISVDEVLEAIKRYVA